MTKAETPEQAERRRERNRNRRKAAKAAGIKPKPKTPEQVERRREGDRQRRSAATIKTVMERAAAETVEATKPATATSKATKAPKAPTGAVEAPRAATKAPTLAQRAAEIGFKVGVNGHLIDLEGEVFYPFNPDDLLNDQTLLANGKAIRGRAHGALEALADFLASRVTGRMPSRTEMRLASLIESLANELSAVADAIPKVLADMADLRKERDQAISERDQLREEKRRTAGIMQQFIGQHVFIQDWPEA